MFVLIDNIMQDVASNFSYFATEIEKCVKLCDNHALRSKAKYDYHGNIFFPFWSTLQNFDLTFLRKPISAFATTLTKRHNYERCIDVTVPHQIILPYTLIIPDSASPCSKEKHTATRGLCNMNVSS